MTDIYVGIIFGLWIGFAIGCFMIVRAVFYLKKWKND